MELTELKALMAASLLAGTVRNERARTIIPDEIEIEAAVKTAQEIWEEILKQDK